MGGGAYRGMSRWERSGSSDTVVHMPDDHYEKITRDDDPDPSTHSLVLNRTRHLVAETGMEWKDAWKVAAREVKGAEPVLPATRSRSWIGAVAVSGIAEAAIVVSMFNSHRCSDWYRLGPLLFAAVGLLLAISLVKVGRDPRRHVLVRAVATTGAAIWIVLFAVLLFALMASLSMDSALNPC